MSFVATLAIQEQADEIQERNKKVPRVGESGGADGGVLDSIEKILAVISKKHRRLLSQLFPPTNQHSFHQDAYCKRRQGALLCDAGKEVQ